MATICCWPPDRVPAFCLSRSPTTGKVSSTISRSCSTAALSVRVYAPSWRFSSTVMSPNRRRFSGTIDTPRRTISVVDLPEITSPSNTTSPDDGVT